MKGNWLIHLTYNFVVHSKESTRRKCGHVGLDPVTSAYLMFYLYYRTLVLDAYLSHGLLYEISIKIISVMKECDTKSWIFHIIKQHHDYIREDSHNYLTYE